MQSGPGLSAEQSNRPGEAGVFGRTLASHFHLEENQHTATEWPEQNIFAVTRLRSDTGLPDRTTKVVSEPALHISIAILPVALRSYELWIDDKPVDVPYIPAYRTSVMDLESDPVCWVGSGFDYVHYHVPRAGLDELAEEHGIPPIGTYRFTICENDIVLAQLTRIMLPNIGTREWTRSLTLDHFSLLVGAHVLQKYAGLPARPRPLARGGLAPWQKRRAMDLIRANLDGSLRLAALARDCGLFHADFAADLPAPEADLMARSQVYLSVKSATAAAVSPAWKTKPSFAIVATEDRAINPDLERSMYKRSHAETIEPVSSHVVYMSHPAEVAALIEKAAQ